MTRTFRALAFLALLGTVFAAAPAFANTTVKRGNTTYIYKGDKPPIVITTGNGNKYIIASDSEKFRNIILNADRLRIVHKPKDDDDWREDYYRNYYRHHKNLDDHDDDEHKLPYYSGYGAGTVIGRD